MLEPNTIEPVEPTFYSGARPHLLRFFDPSGRTVLDVGCGGGGMGPLLREVGATRLVGIEPSRPTGTTSHTYDSVVSDTIEGVLESDSLKGERFDLIVLADVLEHLLDPWTVLRDLVDRHLAVGGQVFISLPNAANLEVVKQLVIRRDWRYEDEGLFDRTHIRWFGSRSARHLIEQAGLTAITWGGRVKISLGPMRYSQLLDDVRKVPKMAIYQFYVLASVD